MSLSLTVVATVKYDKAHQHGVCIYFRGFLRNSNHSLIFTLRKCLCSQEPAFNIECMYKNQI